MPLLTRVGAWGAKMVASCCPCTRNSVPEHATDDTVQNLIVFYEYPSFYLLGTQVCGLKLVFSLLA